MPIAYIIIIKRANPGKKDLPYYIAYGASEYPMGGV